MLSDSKNFSLVLSQTEAEMLWEITRMRYPYSPGAKKGQVIRDLIVEDFKRKAAKSNRKKENGKHD